MKLKTGLSGIEHRFKVSPIRAIHFMDGPVCFYENARVGLNLRLLHLLTTAKANLAMFIPVNRLAISYCSNPVYGSIKPPPAGRRCRKRSLEK